MYVAGGGFSGLCFIHGRLTTLEDPLEQNYVCYSAGCVSVFATLCNYTYQELHVVSQQVQQDWRDGKLSRYNMVEQFLDYMLEHAPSEEHHLERILSTVHIMTSIPSTHGFQAVMTTPGTKAELKTLLLQTTWIPTVTGSHFAYKGHLDGFFSRAQHPQCQHQLGIPPWPKILANVLNVNIDPDTVETLWTMGRDYGI